MDCSICFEKFDRFDRKPIIGLCGHTICLMCCDKLSSAGSSQCPHCNREVSYKQVTVNYQFLDALGSLPEKPATIVQTGREELYDFEFTLDFTRHSYCNILSSVIKWVITLKHGQLSITPSLPHADRFVGISGKWRMDTEFIISNGISSIKRRCTFDSLTPVCLIDVKDSAGRVFECRVIINVEGLGLKSKINYHENNMFTDVCLMVDGSPFYLSKAMLAHNSQWFADGFNKDAPIESRLPPMTRQAFTDFLDVIHGSGIIQAVGDPRTTTLLDLAEQFGCSTVKTVVEDYFLGQATGATWEQKRKLAEHYGMTRLLSYARAKKTL